MGDCQCRNGQGQARDLYMVLLAYSVLRRQLQHGRAYRWALKRLKTIGQACRAVLSGTLSTTISRIVKRFTRNGWNSSESKPLRIQPDYARVLWGLGHLVPQQQ